MDELTVLSLIHNVDVVVFNDYKSNENHTLMCIVHHFFSNKLTFLYTVDITRSRPFSEKKCLVCILSLRFWLWLVLIRTDSGNIMLISTFYFLHFDLCYRSYIACASQYLLLVLYNVQA